MLPMPKSQELQALKKAELEYKNKQAAKEYLLKIQLMLAKRTK